MIGVTARVHGMKAVEARIQKELMGVRGRTYKGMYAAMQYLAHKMDTVNPVVPVSNDEKLHMRDTWFIGGQNHPTNPIIFGGYTADYAPIVHEAWHVQNWTRPGSGPKWLQIHFYREIEQMKMIVASFAMVKGTPSSGAAGTTFTNISNRTNERNVEF